MNRRVLFACLLAFLTTIPIFAQSGSIPLVPAAVELQHPPEPKPLTAFEQTVVDTQKALLQAIDRGDADYVKNAVADDFVVIGTNGDTGSKTELVDAVHPSPKSAAHPPILYDFRVVSLSDNAAIVTYNVDAPGAGLDRYQHMSDTWVKQGDQWKLKFEQTTINLWSAHDL